MAPGVLMGDSGEFQVMAVTGGLAHGTGYPIYLFLARIFTFIPIESIAWRVNFMSAFMGSLAVAEIFLICRALSIRRSYALIAAALVMINPIFWWQSNIAEVYSTTEAVFLAFLLLLVIWRQDRNPTRLAIAGALAGLCWGLHHGAILALPAVILYLIASKAKKGDWKMATIGILAGFAIAMAGYSIMGSIDNNTNAIHSIRPSAGAFGLAVQDFDSLGTRIDFIMNAREFKANLTSQSSQLLSDNFSKYWGETSADFGWPGLLLAAIGIACLFVYKRWRPEGFLFVIAWATMLVFALNFDAYDVEVNFLLGYLLLAIFIGAALQGVHWFATRSIYQSRGFLAATGLGAAALVVVGILPTISGASDALSKGLPNFLKGENRIMPYPLERPSGPHEYATYVVGQMEPNALIIAEWAREWPFYYVAQFEQNKPDLEVIETTPIDALGNPSETYLQYVRAEAAKRPIYSVRIRPYLEREYEFHEIMPGGLYRLIPRR